MPKLVLAVKPSLRAVVEEAVIMLYFRGGGGYNGHQHSMSNEYPTDDPNWTISKCIQSSGITIYIVHFSNLYFWITNTVGTVDR